MSLISKELAEETNKLRDAGSDELLVVGASRAPYIIFGIIFGGLAVFCFFTAWVADSTFWGPGAISLGVYAFTVIWLRSIQVRVDVDGITSSSLFGMRALRWTDIDRAELRLTYRPTYELDEPGHAFRAPFRLVVLTKAIEAKPPISFNIKLISFNDFQKLRRKLIAKLPESKIELPSWMVPSGHH